MIQTEAPAGGHSVATPGGDRQNYYPWGLEHAVSLGAAVPGYLIRYCFPVDDTEYLLAMCLDRMLDPVYRLMTAPDVGDEVCALIARHWPDTFKLLQNGNGMATYPGLMRLSTPQATQFAVASFFTDDSPSSELTIPTDVIRDLATCSFRTLEDLLGWPSNVPGLVEVLGRADRRPSGLADVQDGVEYLTTVLDLFR